MRITKVYTRTGDAGQTALGGGQRLAKDHARVEAYGAVDELNSTIGLVRLHVDEPEPAGLLETIQHHLLDLGGDLCLREEDKQRFSMQPFPAERVTWLEGIVDEALKELPPLKEFVLPAGTPAAAHLHLARCVARRAERRCVTLSAQEPISEQVIPYLNRLSDALFVLARQQNVRHGGGDVLWNKTHRRKDAGGDE